MKILKHFAPVLLLAAGAVAGTGAAQAADVTFMGYSYAEESAKPSVETIIKGFEKQAGLTVEPIGSAWGDMQKNLFLRIRSRTAPDVAQISERWLPTFASVQGLVDYNDVFGKEYLEKTYAPDALAMGQYKGKQLGLPLMSGSIGMVANKAVLKEAGIESIPTTVEDFRKALVAVRDKVPNSVPYGMATKNVNSKLLDFVIWNWTFGGRVTDENGKIVVDSDATRKAVAFMVGLMKDRLIAPEIDRPDARRLMGQNASAFYIDAPQARAFLRSFSGKGKDFDVNVQPVAVPVVKAGDDPKSIQWGHLLLNFAKSGTPSKDAPAEKFLAYLSTDAVQTQFPVEQSGLPATRAGRLAPIVANDTYLVDWAKLNARPLMNDVSIWPNGAELTQIMGEELQAALLGQKSADDAVAAMGRRMTDSMAKAAK